MRVKAVFKRIFKQFVYDKRTMALLIVAPMLVLSLLFLVLNGKEYQPHIALVNLPETIADSISQSQTNKTNIESMSLKKAKEKLSEQKLDGYLTISEGSPKVILEGSSPSKNQAVIKEIRKIMSTNQSQQKLIVEFFHGNENSESFDYFGPVFIGFFAFFFVFLIAGVSFLRERTTGTLERLLATPIRRWEIVSGYILGFGFFSLIQTLIIVSYAIFVLDLLMAGSFFLVLLLTVLAAFTALTLGTLLSAFANNELQMIQFIPLVIVPQFFFSGIFNLETVSDWVSWIGPLTPLYYVADGLRDVMIRGYGWQEVAVNVYVLLAFGIVFMVLNILALRKHRRL